MLFQLKSLNLFHATVHFLYLLKTLENLWLSDVFRGYYSKTAMTRNELTTNHEPVFHTYLVSALYKFHQYLEER